MRFVIDRCCMDSDRLRDFLLLSPQHVAVLTDYSVMESLKGRTLENIETAWRVLRDFPDQIVVLKEAHEAALVRPQEAEVAQQMICQIETRALSKIPKIIASAKLGNEDSLDQLRKLGREVDDHFEQIRARSSELPLFIKSVEGIFSAGELKQLRKASELNEDMAIKLFNYVVHQTEGLCAQHPDNPPMLEPKHLANQFLFRFAVANAAYLIELVRTGANRRNPDDARNDAVDIINVTFATYFHGLMTDDRRAGATYELTRQLLTAYGSEVVDGALDWTRAYPVDIPADFFEILSDGCPRPLP